MQIYTVLTKEGKFIGNDLESDGFPLMESTIAGQWWRVEKLRGARVEKHSYRALNDILHHKTTADDQKSDQCGQLK